MMRIAHGLQHVERTIITGVTVALLILVSIGLVSYLTTSSLLATFVLVDKGHQVQEGLHHLRAHLSDMESSARGYVVTGHEEYFASYQSGVERIRTSLRDLEQSTGDQAQRDQLAQLRSLITLRVALAQAVVDARRKDGFEASQKLVEAGAGKRAMDSVRAVLDEMDSTENDLLAKRAADAQRSAGRATFVISAGMFLTLLVVGIAGLIVRRDMLERRAVENALNESREQLQDFLDNANDLIQSVAPEGNFLYVNRKWHETLGYDRVDLDHLRFQDVVHPDFRQQTEAIRKQVFDGKRVAAIETVLITKDGRSVTVSGHVDARIERGKAVATRSILRNITESKHAEEALQRSNEVLLRSVNELEQRTNEISKLSEMGDLLQSCQKLEEAYKVIVEFVPQMLPSRNGTLGAITSSRNLVEVVAEWGADRPAERVFSPEDCWALRRGRMHLVKDPGSALYCRHLGEKRPESYFCVPLVAQGEAVGLLHLDFSGRPDQTVDLTSHTKLRLIEAVADRVALAMANLKLQEAMRQQSVRDPLTGLFNRRYMEESLERELRRAARSNRTLGILMLDLDFFKHFNDTFGHDAGDAMLREFSRILGANIRGGDIACRYGGEEFAIILPEASLEITRQRAEFLREKTRQLNIQHRGISLGMITLSVGVVACPEHGSTAEALLRVADEALYAAKQSGRDCVVVASQIQHAEPAGAP